MNCHCEICGEGAQNSTQDLEDLRREVKDLKAVIAAYEIIITKYENSL